MKPEYILHQTKEGFIVTSNEEKDLIYGLFNGGILLKSKMNVPIHSQYYKEYGLKVIALQDQLDLSPVPEERQREIGYFDVEKLANNHSVEVYPINGEDRDTVEWIESQKIVLEQGFIGGFQKHAELTSDRRFTEEDAIRFYEIGVGSGKYQKEYGDNANGCITRDIFVQSLSNQSWPAELEMEVCVFGQHSYYDSNIEDYVRPKFTDGKVKILKIN